MTSSMNSVLGSLRRAREWAYPQLSESAFLEKGVLTPEEFVRAGDELVFRCPTWEWSNGGKQENVKSYLPPNKQYLITRNVPCWNRVASLETNLKLRGLDEGDDAGDGEGWMIASDNHGDDDIDGEEPEDTLEDEFDILGDDGEVVEVDPVKERETEKATAASTTELEPEAEATDMDDYVDEDVLYYQVPRVWMVGRDEHDHPLTSSQMMEDVISDYANKTVTMEPHPHVGSTCRHASIHPCQHAKVMKAIVRNLMRPATDGSNSSNDDEEPLSVPSVENYLFIFLKFVSSMIPTINYDFTMDMHGALEKWNASGRWDSIWLAGVRDTDPETIFDEIVRKKEIPATIVREDDTLLVFEDLKPAAPARVLVIPKDRSGLSCLSKAAPEHTEILGCLMVAAGEIAADKSLGFGDGAQIVIKDGKKAGQEVFHLHVTT
eukprot:jgi/Psemu1/326924/estExt_fgenesh1_pg.C_4970013